MGKIPHELRETIARNIRECRMKKFPGRGGGKKCAESFGVSPQQWSPWERGMRTPDELRLSQIANFFGVTVEHLRRDHTVRPPEPSLGAEGQLYTGMYGDFAYAQAASSAMLSEPDAPPYGLPPLRRDERHVPGNAVADLASLSVRILGMVGSIIKGVAENEYDINNTITVLRTLAFYLDKKLREAKKPAGGVAIEHY